MKTTREQLVNVVRPQTLAEWRLARSKHNTILANVWLSEQTRTPWARYYIYYIPARPGVCDGDITLAEATPTGYTLADTEAIRRDQTPAQLLARLNDLCERLPLIGLLP